MRWQVVEDAPYRNEVVAVVRGDSPPPSPRLVDISTPSRPRHLLILGRSQGPLESPGGTLLRYTALFLAVVPLLCMILDGIGGRPYATTFAILLAIFSSLYFALFTWGHQEVWMTEQALCVGRFLGRIGCYAQNPLVAVTELAVFPIDPKEPVDFITEGTYVAVGAKEPSELQAIGTCLWLPREQLVWIRDHLATGLEMMQPHADPANQASPRFRRLARAPRGMPEPESRPPAKAA